MTKTAFRLFAPVTLILIFACGPADEDDQVCTDYVPLPLDGFTTADSVVPSGCYDIADMKRIQAAITIEAGTKIRATDPSAGLRVEDGGSLRALGTEDQPIVFTSASETPGAWTGLRIGTDDDNLLRHVIVEYAGNWTNAFHLGPYNTAVRVESSASLTLDSATIRKAATGADQFSAGLFLERGAVVQMNGHNQFVENEGAGVHVTAPQIQMLDPDADYGAEASENGLNVVLVNDDATSAPPVVAETQTWPALNVPYRLVRVITIEGEGNVVTVLPGARFEAASDAGIRVRDGAGLKAVGSEDEPIVFTGILASAGAWPGFHINTAHTANEFRHAIIEHAGENSLPFNPVGGGGIATAVRVGDGINEGVGAGQAANLTFFDNIVRASGGSGMRLEHSATGVTPTALEMPIENEFDGVATVEVDDAR